jgi:hypothetical protein
VNQLLIDIECYGNYFLLGCQDYQTGEQSSFEIGKHINQRKELFELLQTYSGFWISFNGIHYDNMVLAHGQRNRWWMNEEPEVACRKLKAFSDAIIHAENLQPYSTEKYWKWKFTNIDLFLYWSKGLRLSKKISLKGLGIQLGYPVVQELPFDPSMILDQEQIKELKHYNLEHDLGILNLLTKSFDNKSKVSIGNLGTIQLRDKISSDYKINAWSLDTPKIASEILAQSYSKITGKDLKKTRDLRFEKDSFQFKDIFQDIPVRSFELPELQKVYKEWSESYNVFSTEFITGTENHPLKVSVGVGGIHSVNNNEVYEASEDQIIITDDIAALYPTAIENLKAFRFPEVLETYIGFKHLRMNKTKPGLKSTTKGSKEWTDFYQEDMFAKLVLNSVSGLLDMEYSWLYYNIGIMKVRCMGQLILLTLMEKCILNKIDVISMNTDGLEVKLHPDKYNLYLNLVALVEKQFNVQFEREQYKKIVYSNVNSYVAITESGSIKKKGQFVTNPDLGNSVDFLVIAKLLEQYFVYGVNPKEVLSNPTKYNLHIYDFCASFKVNRDYQVLWNNQKQQRLNRFYVKSKGAYLYKLKNSKSKPDNMLKGWGVEIYNNHIEQPLSEYSIDMRYYLTEVNSIISKIEHHSQLQLF